MTQRSATSRYLCILTPSPMNLTRPVHCALGPLPSLPFSCDYPIIVEQFASEAHGLRFSLEAYGHFPPIMVT